MDNAIHLADKKVFYAFASVLVLSSISAVYMDTMALAIAPIALLFLGAIVIDIRILYYGFFALIPFSIELEFGSLGTDFPSEPMMLGLTGIAIILAMMHLKSIDRKVIYHPISVLLLMHVAWILIASIFSVYPMPSIKFFVAKLWYIIPFYGLSMYILRTDSSIYSLYKCVSVFLLIAVSIVLFRHALEGFTFASSNKVVSPIFRNHVNYAAIIVVVIPYMWAYWMKERKTRALGALFILIMGTYFSYTRAAHLCLFIMIGGYYVYKYNFVKIALTGATIGAILLCTFLLQNNRFLDYTPDFNKTITHKEFDNLVEATYKLEDVSTMERVYRWVAGVEMIKRRPIVGFGPSGFYFNYKNHTISSFETFVSDNPEKSGIHCYYLMTWVEQGVIGFLIFVFLCGMIVLVGARAYRNASSTSSGHIIMAACLSNLSILALLIINDLIEADKVGPFFFLNAAIIALYDLKNRKSQQQKTLAEAE